MFFAGCGNKEERDIVTLKFWHAWGGHEGKALESLVDEFNATHPHIRVKPSFFTIGDKILAAIAGGVPPDVATVWDYMLVNMGESGCFLPLEQRMIDAGYTRDAYLHGIWEYGVYGEHHWGVPTTLNCLAIYYNKEIVSEAGLDPDNPPSTIEELEAWAEKLTVIAPDGTIKRMGFDPGNQLVWFWNFGGGAYDEETRTLTLDNPANVKALKWMSGLFALIGVDNWRRFQSGFGAYLSPQNPFFNNKIAMRGDGQWLIMFIKQFAPNLKFGVFPFPNAVTGGPGYTYVSGSFWVIPVGTKHPDEAWEFLSWLIAPAQSARFAAALYNIPPLKATLERPDMKSIKDEEFWFFVDQLRRGRARAYPPLPITNLMVQKLGQTSEMVYGDKLTAEDALATLQKDMERELERSLKFIGVE